MRKKHIHSGHRKRVKDEFRKMGMEHFPPHKVLEMLLFYSIPQGDTNEIGHYLMDSFGSLAGVFDAPIDLLTRVPGIGPESATHIRFVGDLIRRYLKEQDSPPKIVRTTKQAKELMRSRFLSESAECAYLACLGGSGKVIYSEKMFAGSRQRVEIVPSDLVRIALLSNAAKVILAHNHPDGICNPSREDVHTTKIVFEQMRNVGVELMDHIIVASDGICSMAESNMLPGW